MFSDPKKIIPALNIQPGSSVADLGAGVGAYTIPISKIVGATGKVYACDVQKDILTRLESELKQLGITNVQTVLANVETHLGTKLRDHSVDWVIVANVLFQIEDRPGFINEISRIMKPNGRVLLVDWMESFGNLGPHENEVIKPDIAEQLFNNVGLKKSPIVIDAGAHHYGMIFWRTL